MAIAVHVASGLLAAARIPRISIVEAMVRERPPWLRIAAGGQHATRIADGEVWRLATSVFVHADGLHLLVNSAALLALGLLIERRVGTLRWLSWFAAGGMVGSVAAHVAGVPVSDGASGGAFALLGATAVLDLRSRRVRSRGDHPLLGPTLWLLIAANLGLSFVVPTIDPFAHLGGLATGFVAGLLPERSSVRVVERAMFVVFCASCLYGWVP